MDSAIKFIHWEYNSGNLDDLSKEPELEMKAGIIRVSKTSKPAAYYIRWTIRLYSCKGLFLSCTGEDQYSISNEGKLSINDTSFVIDSSLKKFKAELFKRLEIVDIDFTCNFDFGAAISHASILLSKLRS
jgi:hypothetical protein